VSCIVLRVAYDGGAYFGWQETLFGPTIEGMLKAALEKILREPITLQAASRTDRGVHAAGQIVNFTPKRMPGDLKKLLKSLNSLLPKDIVVQEAALAPDSFHPTLDCVAKEYRYFITTRAFQPPHQRHYAWHYPHPLEIEAMRLAASALLGKRDFRTFCNQQKKNSYADTVRQLNRISIDYVDDHLLSIQVVGNHFLYNMVRNIVGTLAMIGAHRLDKDSIPAMLAHKRREHAGVTAPAHGLSLWQVFYPKSEGAT
jgi:tRNA pseudouridine38-40 synthase